MRPAAALPTCPPSRARATQEIEGFKKDITAEQLKHESLTSVVRKVEGDAAFVQKQIDAAVEKQGRLQVRAGGRGFAGGGVRGEACMQPRAHVQ